MCFTPLGFMMFKLTISLLAIASCAAAPDLTYGLDHSGMDYRIMLWHTPANESGNHYFAAASACEALCVNDPACCSFTYCTPEAGPSDPERWYVSPKGKRPRAQYRGNPLFTISPALL